MNRIKAISPESMTVEQRRVADEIAGGPRGGVRGPFIALLHSPALAQRLQGVGEYLRFKSHLPQDLLELAVLVTARHWSCQFEWLAHAPLARKTGLSEGIITAIALGERPTVMTRQQALVYDFAIELHRGFNVTDHTFAAAADVFGTEQVIDLVAVCGYYATLAMVLNTAQLPLPDGAAAPLQPL